ncbi:UvrD-helicase domain-containing protein, partial [candidate division WOR-3 bacterium]|nr:UvrD-helicase domain-containing protein [candidate division WOR-3 bacterium]
MGDENIKSKLEEIVRLEKPVLVTAGPGMGKTYTLAYKLKYLVETKKIDPGAITVITFTNEAAINMRRRISNKRLKETYIKPELQPVNICTMHKLGHGIVKRNAVKLGLNRNINVLSTNKLKEILIKDCAQIIGVSREDAKETIMCRQKGRCRLSSSTKCKICTEYKSLLRRFNYID